MAHKIAQNDTLTFRLNMVRNATSKRGHSTTTWTEFFFDPSLCGQFLYPKRGQKQTFFDPLP